MPNNQPVSTLHAVTNKRLPGGGRIFKGKYGNIDVAVKKHSTSMDADHNFDGDMEVLSQLAHSSILRVYGVSESPAGDLYTVLLVVS